MRKKINLFIVLFFIIMSTQISAQTFTLEELAAFNKLEMSDFKKEMKKLKIK